MPLTRALAAVAATALLALTTGCGGDPQSAPTATASTSTTSGPTTQSPPTPSTTTSPPSTTATPTPSTTATSPRGTASSVTATTARPTTARPATALPTTGPPTTRPATRTPTASPTQRSPAASPRADPWPKALGEPAQGDPVWAVYLALAHASDDPALDQAVRRAARAGYTAIKGDLACDQGGVEALKVDPYDFWSAVALYFDTADKARTFVRSYQASGGKVVGSARVELGCLD